MRIKPKYITIRGVEYKHYYSKNGFLIQKVGTEELYSDAIDALDALWEYEETDVPINPPEEVQSNGE